MSATRTSRPPSMEALLSSPDAAQALLLYGREAVKEELCNAMSSGEIRPEALLQWARTALIKRFSPSLRTAVNGTGVLLHTNLGRAPLSTPAREALCSVAAGYSTLEYDPESGDRGRRQDHVRGALRDLFGVEDALAVNNNAAAVFLILQALAQGRRVVISRGELVAIGGSFQIPEILEASGAILREVGTTNRTTIEDYRRALSPESALLLTVHPSNYEVRGYTARPEPREIAALARQANLPWVHDQGTGCVVPLDEFGVHGEPTVSECLEAGADLVTFSGDKLFAGPQAGLIVGRADLIARLASHPVARAVRPDKLTLAALSATLAAWKTGKWREFPIYRAAGMGLAALEERGARIGQTVGASLEKSGFTLEGIESLALFGGGTSPEKRFPSRALALRHEKLSADTLAARLRAASPPIVGRVEEGRLLLDLRSIAPEEDAGLEAALRGLGGEIEPVR